MVRPAKKRSLTSSAFAESSLEQLVEGLVEGFEVFGRSLRQEIRGLQLDAQAAAAMLATLLAASVLDQDPAHRLRGRGEEVGAAVPLRLRPFADEPEIGLVDQVGRLKGLPRCLAGEPLGGQPAQFLVDQRQEFSNT